MGFEILGPRHTTIGFSSRSLHLSALEGSVPPNYTHSHRVVVSRGSRGAGPQDTKDLTELPKGRRDDPVDVGIRTGAIF